MLTIDEIWVFCVVDPEDGAEGLMSTIIGKVRMPLVCADLERVEALRPVAEQAARQTGMVVRLKHFSTMTVVETIQPKAYV